MRLTLLFPVLFLILTTTGNAQNYKNVVQHRPVLWTQVDFAYRTPTKWSFQLDYLYRRQADDANGHDLNLVHYPLLQVLRPWVTYQLSKPIRLSLSPISLWWSWSQTSHSPLVFSKSLRTTPQVVFTKPVGRAELVLRFRTEFRWLTTSDTLLHEFDFLGNAPLPYVRSDARPRLMVRWVQPLSRRQPAADSWFMQTSVEPVANISTAGTRLDQLQVSVIFGQRVSENFRFSLGYQGTMAARKNEATHIRTIQLTHALTLSGSIGNRLRKQPGTNPVSQ